MGDAPAGHPNGVSGARGRRLTYQAICADPPWAFRTWSEAPAESRSANLHYATMSLAAIKALPVADLAANNCALFLWVTDPMLERGLEVIRSWGFKFSTVAFTWVKTNSKSGGFFTGLGWWTRANAEMCLLATKGRPSRLAKDVKRLIVSPRREHSRKPDEAYSSIERLVGGPYCELFARTRRPGWDIAFSDEPERFQLAA